MDDPDVQKVADTLVENKIAHFCSAALAIRLAFQVALPSHENKDAIELLGSLAVYSRWLQDKQTKGNTLVLFDEFAADKKYDVFIRQWRPRDLFGDSDRLLGVAQHLAWLRDRPAPMEPQVGAFQERYPPYPLLDPARP